MTIGGELNFSHRRSLPSILAAEGAECGLACLAMIGRYWGHDIDLNGLRQRYSVSLAGANLRNMMDLAAHLGLASRPLKVPLQDLERVAAPAVLHWDLNHFVVLKSLKRGRAVIHDPAKGVRRMSLDEVSGHYTGVVLELSPAGDFAPIEARAQVRITSLWSRSHGLTLCVAQVLALSLLLQLFSFIAPLQTQLVIDDAIGTGDLDLLGVLAIGFGAVFIIQALVGALRGWVTTTLGALFSFQVVGNLVRHLLRLPGSFFEKRHVGDILSRMGSAGAIQDAVTQGVISAIVDGSMALVAGLILFVYSPFLAMIVVISLALSLVVALAYYPISRRRTLEGLQASANERSYIMETIRAATTIKLMGRSSVREGSWRNLYAATQNIGVLNAKYNIWVGLLQQALVGVQAILVLYFGARIVLQGEGFSVGMLIAFTSYRATFSDRVVSLINQAIRFKMLGLHLDRLGDIVTAPAEASVGVAQDLEVQGGIKLANVSFRYGDPDPWILKDVSLEIQPGDFIAITGPSGGGKSTLLKLMLGLQRPVSGEVFLDGQPARPELFEAWRRQIGVVAQNDQLLSGSIAENIAFFDPDLDMGRVRQAATDAQVHADILRMPMQYESLIGDMGSSLSGGQRQRVLLARALYRKPKILFLDEGTANLDEATEDLIADLIAGLPVTRIIVAHRPALIARADRVVAVRDQGVEVVRGGRKVVSGVL